MTVTLVREGRPVELIRMLKGYGLAVEKRFDGIYYVEGFFFPVQIVVAGELDGGENMGLKVLSRNASEEDISRFIEMALKATSQGDRANVDAILQVSVSANYKLYEEMKRRDSNMCEAMMRLMKDEIQNSEMNAEQKGRQEGKQEGKREGILETLFGLVKEGILTVSDAAGRANMKVSEFEKAYKTFLM